MTSCHEQGNEQQIGEAQREGIDAFLGARSIMGRAWSPMITSSGRNDEEDDFSQRLLIGRAPTQVILS